MNTFRHILDKIELLYYIIYNIVTYKKDVSIHRDKFAKDFNEVLLLRDLKFKDFMWLLFTAKHPASVRVEKLHSIKDFTTKITYVKYYPTDDGRHIRYHYSVREKPIIMDSYHYTLNDNYLFVNVLDRYKANFGDLYTLPSGLGVEMRLIDDLSPTEMFRVGYSSETDVKIHVDENIAEAFIIDSYSYKDTHVATITGYDATLKK